MDRRGFLGGIAATGVVTVGIKHLQPYVYTPEGITGQTYVFPTDGRVKTYLRKYRNQQYELSGQEDFDTGKTRFKVYWRKGAEGYDNVILPLRERVVYAIGCYGDEHIQTLEFAMCRTIDKIRFKDKVEPGQFAVHKPEATRLMYI